MSSDWYRDWFLSDEYIDVYLHRNDEEAERFLKTVLKFIDIPEASVLDAACGAGRHSIALAKRGFRVTAFDLSINLLKLAFKKAEKENLHVNFFKADFKNVGLKPGFDLIINAFTSFGYFETDEENFRFICDSVNFLNKGGKFVLDYMNIDFLKKNLIPYSEKYVEEKKIIERRKIIDERIVKEICIENGSMKKCFIESVRMYSHDFLVNELKTIGFEIEKILGNYDGDTFDPVNSDRIILICGRN